jgi:hypothetical protein
MSFGSLRFRFSTLALDIADGRSGERDSPLSCALALVNFPCSSKCHRALRFPTCMAPSCPSNSPPSPRNTKSTSKIQVMDISPHNIVLGLEKASSVPSDELASKLEAAAPTVRLINAPRSSHESSGLICIALALGSKVSAQFPGSPPACHPTLKQLAEAVSPEESREDLASTLSPLPLLLQPDEES